MDNNDPKTIEPKIMYERASENKEILNLAFDSAPFILIVVNQEGRVEKMNQASISAFGKKKEEVIGLLGGEVFRCINSLKGDGCGRNEECADCTIRNSVMHTFLNAENIYKREANLNIELDGSVSTR